MPDTNYKLLEGFVTLGTHSESRRGDTSHTCDITLLRVKIRMKIENFFAELLYHFSLMVTFITVVHFKGYLLLNVHHYY